MQNSIENTRLRLYMIVQDIELACFGRPHDVMMEDLSVDAVRVQHPVDVQYPAEVSWFDAGC